MVGSRLQKLLRILHHCGPRQKRCFNDMGRRCCIEGCNSRSSAPEHHGVTYHSYPLDAAIRAVWMKNTRLPSDRTITKSVLVCSRHFRRADFQPIKSGKYLLKQRVFPTVFPWGKLGANAMAEAASITSSDTDNVETNTASPEVDSPPTTEAVTTSATVEATVAQILAETAELNAVDHKSLEIKESEAFPQLGKRAIYEQRTAVEDEPANKQARTTAVEVTTTNADSSVVGAKFEPVTVFNPGVRLEAQDFDGMWHLARVVEVDNDDREVLIKFEKGGKHKSAAALASEEWIPMNSSRLRQKISSKPIPVFELEDKVMARWSGPRRFPGTIKKIIGNDTYEVLFDDGFVKNVRAIHMNKIVSKLATAASAADTAKAAPTTPTSSIASPAMSTPKPKRSPTFAATKVTPTAKSKRFSSGSRKDWPLLQMDKLDLASLNLPEIPMDGEWTCHWVNDQPIGKEGFLIVGENRKPTVVVDDWRLPAGWVKHMYQRSNVLGKWDVILVSPGGKRFRSKADLKVYLEDQGKVFNPDIYDFSIHRRRAKDINAYAFTPDYIPQQPKTKPSDSYASAASAVATNVSTINSKDLSFDEKSSANAASSSASSSHNPQHTESAAGMSSMDSPVTTAISTSQLLVGDPIVDATEATPAEDGVAYIGDLKVQIVDNLFRCPHEGCLKNFRKENHLQIHVKHYHRDLIKLLGDCPKMQELAEKRTIGPPDPNEPQPKNQIPNQQFFAKLHQQDLEQSRSHRRSVGATASALTTIASEKIVADANNTAHRDADEEIRVAAEVGVAAHVSADDDDIMAPIDKNMEAANNTTLNSSTAANSTVTDNSQINTTAESSLLELSSNADVGSAAVLAAATLPPKRPRFSPAKRPFGGARKSSRQRTTRRYLTAAQATAGAGSSFSAGDFEETRHSFNATPDAKPADVKRRKAAPVVVAPATPLSSLDSPVTADSGSASSFQPLLDEAPPNSLATPQYIKENGELIKIVRMRQEEIINCLCSYGEEDGLMIQCELCLCWQHGGCNGIEKESDVPDKYVCYICRNPQRGRESMRYKHDQDWLYEGKLPVASYHNANPDHVKRFELLKKSHMLTGNLTELKRFMHSLRVKINIANNKGHPKMYLWAKKWDEEDVKTDNVKEEDEGTAPERDNIKPAQTTQNAENTKLAQNNKNDDSEAGVKRTGTPIKQQQMKSESPPPPPMPNIPQPEAAIDSAECQTRLLEHIKVQQSRVMERLLKIETEIDDLEKLDTLPDLKSADLSTTKDVVSSFIKELDIMKQIAKVNSLEHIKQAMNANNPIFIK